MLLPTWHNLPDIKNTSFFVTCSSLVTVPQTKVSYFQQADPKGLIPKFLVDSKIENGLTFLSNMRKKFDKSLEVDQTRRAELVPKIEQLPVGEGAGVVEAQFVELFAERKGSEEVKLKLHSAANRIKVEKVRESKERSDDLAYGAARSKVTLHKHLL